MDGELVATAAKFVAEQFFEVVIGELGLLQADDVRLPLVEPRQQTGHALLDRVHVPGRYPHRAKTSGSRRRANRSIPKKAAPSRRCPTGRATRNPRRPRPD